VRKLGRRLAIVGVSAVVALTMLGSPAQAATNPYTAAEACNNDFGGSWASTSDGHLSVYAGSTKVGDVYLMYNSSTGYNCVTTIKRVSIGTKTPVMAQVLAKGGSEYAADSGNYKYYAAKQTYAKDTCVVYGGWVYYNGVYNREDQDTWSNCD